MCWLLSAKWKADLKRIAKVENYLINLGITSNPNLVNQHYTKTERRGLRGLIRGGKGKVGKGTGYFREMLRISV